MSRISKNIQTPHFIDPDDPVLWGVGFFQNVQLEVFVSDLSVSHPVIAGRPPCKFLISFHPSKEIFTSFGVDLAKPVVTHLVHQTVQHSAASLSINSEIISNIKVSSRKISYQLLSFINVLSVVHPYQSCRKSSTREGRILININFSSHSIYFFSGLSFLSVV